MEKKPISKISHFDITLLDESVTIIKKGDNGVNYSDVHPIPMDGMQCEFMEDENRYNEIMTQCRVVADEIRKLELVLIQ